ncbi:MAG TPA: diacylglycerol kinase family protein [Caulobacteraceae bacterium]|nr:diacylglycerol kinase family protein [Caulobacteraceae bacterium]
MLLQGIDRLPEETGAWTGPAPIRRAHGIVNPASGGVAPGASAELASLLDEFGLDYEVSELAPGRFETTVRSAIDGRPDVVVVLGGDGTTRLVAEMCGPAGPLIAPLSGGTMNKLDHGLYGARPWREALSTALAAGEARWVSGGEVDGRAFYCRAVLGSPALWARAREAFRARRFGRAQRHAAIAFRRAFRGRLAYVFDGEQIGRGLAIGFISPTVSRAADVEAALETAVIEISDLRAAARLAVKNLIGDWRDDPDVTVRPCVRARVWAREPISAMLDGEYFRFGRGVEVRFRPRAFRVLAPPALEEAGEQGQGSPLHRSAAPSGPPPPHAEEE